MEERRRHGCATTWLILLLILNSTSAFVYLLLPAKVLELVPEEANLNPDLLSTIGYIAALNFIAAILLLWWFKLGFWLATITSIAMVIINVMNGMSPIQAGMGLIGLAILYAVLKIKHEDITAWEQLK